MCSKPYHLLLAQNYLKLNKSFKIKTNSPVETVVNNITLSFPRSRDRCANS